MPISMANPGDTVIIRRITGTDKVKNHLAELGFVVDGEVTIISKVDNGIICNVKVVGLRFLNRWRIVYCFKGGVS